MTAVKLLSILLFVETVKGEYRVIYLPQTIEAEEGDDVTLQCRLDPWVNLSADTVDWKRVDLNMIVHAYRHKQDHLHPQTDQYRNRTTLNHEDLSRGVLTLQISSVKLSDSGQYRCYVPQLKARCVIDLTVVEKDQQDETKRDDSTTTGPPEEEVTEPDDPDGENMNAVRAVVISTVVFVLFVLIVVLVLKSGTIQDCMERLRGRKEQKPETAANGCEMKKLNTQASEVDEDLERPAENGLGNIV